MTKTLVSPESSLDPNKVCIIIIINISYAELGLSYSKGTAASSTIYMASLISRQTFEIEYQGSPLDFVA